MSRLDAERRFWAHVDQSGDCWLWTGCVAPSGYGQPLRRCVARGPRGRSSLPQPSLGVDGRVVIEHCGTLAEAEATARRLRLELHTHNDADRAEVPA